MKRTFILALAAALAAHGVSHAAQMELYETGPAQDASFLRFVNGGTMSMDVSASGSQARITLDGKQPASNFLPVRAGAALQGTLTSGAAKQVVSVTAQPGEFVSVVGVAAADGTLRSVTLREQPDDFNALKASLGFYNLDSACANAGLMAAGRNVAIFERVADGATARRQVNPVALSVQPSCGGKPVGQPLDLGTLQAGERYTVFLLPSAQGPRLLRAVDSLAN